MNASIHFIFSDGRKALMSSDFISLDLERTDGDPCCAFEARLIFSEGAANAARSCARVRIYEGGTLRFTGVLDEVITSRDADGRTLELAGRGLAALLMQRECEGAEFTSAAWQDIKSRYVTPCGISSIDADTNFGTVSRFSVVSGTNAWKVLCDWAGAASKLSPRFAADGTLILRKNPPRGRLSLTSSDAIISAERRTLRSGIISEVRISERTSGRAQTVSSAALKSAGHTARAAIAAPSGALLSRVAPAEWMLLRAERDSDVVMVTIPTAFAAEPCDELALTLDGFPASSRIMSVRTTIDAHGARSTVTAYVPLS